MDGIERAQIIYGTCKDFILTDDQCFSVVKAMEKEVQEGLGIETNMAADVKCRATFIRDLLNGEEYGKFLGIDLGLYIVNIVMIDNTGQETDKEGKKNTLSESENMEAVPDFEITQKAFVIPKKLFNIKDGRKLFNFLIQCLGKFLTELEMQHEKFSLGLSFSFPSEQLSLTEASIISWTHHFNCEGVIGMDIVRQLRKAIKRQGYLKIIYIVILKSISATLISSFWKNTDCSIGVVVDNICNASYLENVQKVETLSSDFDEGEQYMVINTEWGALGENGALSFLVTDIDKEMDAITYNKEQQVYEKMISTVYLGELVRRTLINLMEASTIFVDKYSERLLLPWTFTHQDIITIESDKPGKYQNCRRVLRRFELCGISDADCATVRFVCETITTRSAHLVACGLVALLQRLEPESNHVIGIEGCLYREHPKYADLLNKKMRKLLKNILRYEIIMSPEIPGLGAALLAAIYHRMNYNSETQEEEYISESSETEKSAKPKFKLCVVEIENLCP